MYSFLIIGVLLAGALIFFRLRLTRSMRPWTKLLQAASEAESRGDLAAAERCLNDADTFAASQKGAIWSNLRQVTRQRLAQLLFRKGQLDRCASLTFDILNQARAAT